MNLQHKDEEDDIQEHISKLRDMFQKKKIDSQEQQDLNTFTNLLITELKQARQIEQALRKSLQVLLQDENSNFSNKYIELKEKYKNIEQELGKLREENDIASLQHLADMESLKFELTENQKHLEKSYHEKIKMLEAQLAEQKKCHKDEVQGLRDQIEWIQATADMQREEIESQLKRQLVDANARLRQAHNSIRELNMKQKPTPTKQVHPSTNTELEFIGIKEPLHQNFNPPSRPTSNLSACAVPNPQVLKENNFNIPSRPASNLSACGQGYWNSNNCTNHNISIERPNRSASAQSFASSSTKTNKTTSISRINCDELFIEDDIEMQNNEAANQTIHPNEAELEEIENAIGAYKFNSNLKTTKDPETVIGNKEQTNKLHSKHMNIPPNESSKRVHIPATFTKYNQKKSSLPPLKEISSSKNQTKNGTPSGIVKRRKLYNASDLTYLDSLKKS